MMQRALLSLLCFASTLLSFGQLIDEKKFIAYNVSNGLSSNFVTSIVQDSAGFVWIGTNRGLNRFDGTSFRQFFTSTSYPLVDNGIYSMKLLPGGELAIATNGGAQLLSTHTLESKLLDIPTSDQMRYWSNSCRFIEKDVKGNYGVSSKTGFYIFSPAGKLIKRFDRYSDTEIGKEWMNYGTFLYQLPDGNLMQQHVEGLTVYNHSNGQLADAANHATYLKNLLPALVDIRFYFLSNNFILIFNTKTDELELFNLKSGTIKKFAAGTRLANEVNWRSKLVSLRNNTWAITSGVKGIRLVTIDTLAEQASFGSQKLFANYLCTDLIMDAANRIWVATTKGLLMEKHTPAVIQSTTFDTVNGVRPWFNCLLVTGDKIFAGTLDETIFVLEKASKRILKSFSLKSREKNKSIPYAILEINSDTVWISTYTGLFWIDTRNLNYGEIQLPATTEEFVGNNVLFKDSRNNVWVGCDQINKLYVYSLDKKTWSILSQAAHPQFRINVAYSITEDKDGKIWVAGDAIARWDPVRSKIDTLIELLPTQKNRKKGFAVMSDSNGDIWAVVNDDGFALLSGERTPLHLRPPNFTSNQSGVVYPSLFSDKIFTSTITGFGYLNTKNGRAVVFNETDGIPGQSITSYRFHEDRSDQSIWFAVENSICRLVNENKNYYTSSPLLLIGEVAVINHRIISYPSETIRLRHNQNDISITMNAINFTDPANMRFAYRFKNKKDSSWIEMGTQPTLLLTNISPGKYDLQVKVYAYDNKWPDQMREANIIIRPPFWNTAWFRILVLSLVAALVYLLYNYRIRKINQRADLDRLLAQTEMKALHSQMNPHFIFNCLNSIKKMILENENQNASRYLSKFAQLIRDTLNQSTKPYISLRHTIEHLQRYLEMEQIRSNKFTWTIQTAPEINPEEIFMPPMLIQPLLENAIWHGGGNIERILNIRIFFSRKYDQVVCTVEDDGIGLNASLQRKQDSPGHHSLGIANIRQRIQLLNEKHKLTSTIIIEDRSAHSTTGETGTIAILRLPIKYSEL